MFGDTHGDNPDLILLAAMAKESEALAEARKWTEWIAGYKELMGVGGKSAGVVKGRVKRERRAGKSSAIVDFIGERIDIAGCPLPAAELYDQATDTGYEFGGLKPEKTFAAHLSNARNKFVSIKGHGWWFRDRPYPSAGYYPETNTPPEGGVSGEVSAGGAYDSLGGPEFTGPRRG